MKLVKTNKILTVLVLLILVFTLSGISTALELTLEEAIKQGLKKNSDLRNLEENIAGLERDLALIKAGQDWQVKMGADYGYTFEDSNNRIEENRVNLGISRVFSSGLTIEPEITVTENDSNPDLSIALRYPLLPSVPTESAKQYYKIEQELIKAQGKLSQEKAAKIISWLEKYLNLSRLTEKHEVYQQGLELAEDNLNEVLLKQEMGEAGREEVLTAQISLADARYQLDDLEKQIEEVKLSLYQELGLEKEQELVIDDQSKLIAQLSEKAEQLTGQELDESKLMPAVEQNSYELLANRIDREVLKQELEWLKGEGKTELNLSGNYNSKEEEISIGLSLSYNLYDGGQRELKYEEKEVEIANNLAEYNDLYAALELQLKQQINKVELSQSKLQQEELKLEKSVCEEKVGRQQYEMGLIDKNDYEELCLQRKESEINFKSFQDQLLINKIELITFIKSDDILGGF